MKLQSLLPEVTERFKSIPSEIVERHAANLKESGNYKDFYTRISWDCLHAVYSPSEICDWYDQYNCNDAHITTLVKSAFHNAFQNI